MGTTQHFETEPVLCRARSKMNDEELYFIGEAELPGPGWPKTPGGLKLYGVFFRANPLKICFMRGSSFPRKISFTRVV